MKLAFAALATTFALASGASAMIGTYERAVNDPTDNAHLFTMGESQKVTVQDRSNSPEGTFGDDKQVTVFQSDADRAPLLGVHGR